MSFEHVSRVCIYIYTHLYQFSCVSTAKPAASWGARNAKAWRGEMSFRASGRVFVRSVWTSSTAQGQYKLVRVGTGREGGANRDVPTAVSKFRSHRSLMVHPAPRIIKAPVPNRVMYVRGTDGGALSAYEAMVIDQAAGRSGILRGSLICQGAKETNVLHG